MLNTVHFQQLGKWNIGQTAAREGAVLLPGGVWKPALRLRKVQNHQAYISLLSMMATCRHLLGQQKAAAMHNSAPSLSHCSLPLAPSPLRVLSSSIASSFSLASPFSAFEGAAEGAASRRSVLPSRPSRSSEQGNCGLTDETDLLWVRSAESHERIERLETACTRLRQEVLELHQKLAERLEGVSASRQADSSNCVLSCMTPRGTTTCQ